MGNAGILLLLADAGAVAYTIPGRDSSEPQTLAELLATTSGPLEVTVVAGSDVETGPSLISGRDVLIESSTAGSPFTLRGLVIEGGTLTVSDAVFTGTVEDLLGYGAYPVSTLVGAGGSFNGNFLTYEADGSNTAQTAVYIDGGDTVTISSSTFSSLPQHAIKAESGALTLDSNRFTNIGDSAVVLYNEGLGPSLWSSFDTFSGNRGSTGADITAVRASGVVLDNSTFLGGVADQGGAIWAYDTTLEARELTMEGSSAIDGGAIYLVQSTLQGNNLHIDNTIASDSGGAIYSWEGDTQCDSCTFDNTSAQYGGAIIDNFGILSCPTCSFTNTFADEWAGAIMLNGSSATLDHSIWTGVSGGTGRGAGVVLDTLSTSEMADPALSCLDCAFVDGDAEEGASTLYLSGDTTRRDRVVLSGSFSRPGLGSPLLDVLGENIDVEISNLNVSGPNGSGGFLQLRGGDLSVNDVSFTDLTWTAGSGIALSAGEGVFRRIRFCRSVAELRSLIDLSDASFDGRNLLFYASGSDQASLVAAVGGSLTLNALTVIGPVTPGYVFNAASLEMGFTNNIVGASGAVGLYTLDVTFVSSGFNLWDGVASTIVGAQTGYDNTSDISGVPGYATVADPGACPEHPGALPWLGFGSAAVLSGAGLNPDGSTADRGALGGPDAGEWWTAYPDSDGDGVSVRLDCDDADPGVYPGAPDPEDDGVDSDCDGSAEVPVYPDLDGDGAPSDRDCDDADPARYPGAAEAADGLDNDCDGAVEDLDADGSAGDVDCDDDDDAVFPGADEQIDDGVDQDCDGADTTSSLGGPGCGCRSSGSAPSAGLLAALLVMSRRRGRITPMILTLMVLFFGLVPQAYAVDLHGTSVVGSAGELVCPAEGPEARSGDFGLMMEAMGSVATITTDDGTTQTTSDLLSDVLGMSLAGTWGLSDRVGLGATVPMWLGSTWLGETQSARLGDVRVAVPVTLKRGELFSLGVIPALVLPTGDADIGLGAASLGAQVMGAGSLSTERLTGTLNLGLSRTPDDVADNLDRNKLVLVRAGLELRPVEPLVLGLSLWAAANPGGGGDDVPAELIGRVGWRPGSWGLDLSAGGTVSGAAGSASWRSILAVSRRFGPAKPTVEPVVVEAPAPAGPYDLQVSTLDGGGSRVDAEVRAARVNPANTASSPDPSDANAQTARTGASGEALLRLSPGTWSVQIQAEGTETQVRTLVLDEGRFRPASIEAVLQPASLSPEAEPVSLSLADTEGLPVADARVSVGGLDRGTTSTGGDLVLVGATAGDVAVSAAGFEPLTSTSAVGGMLTLQRPPGAVKVVVRSSLGVVSDAVVRLRGPETLDPVEVGPTGEKNFVLQAGTWSATVSAASYGVQRRSFELPVGRADLMVVDVVLQPVAGPATLAVRAVDADGAPVAGATLSVDGVAAGATSNTGELEVEGLSEGAHTLVLSGRRFRPTAPIDVDLGVGRREIEVGMRFAPGTLKVVVRGPTGPVPGTAVRFTGPETLPPLGLDPTGERVLSLSAGTWTATVSSPAFGLQRRVIVVEPDEERLLLIDAVLREAEGEGTASLTLRVLGPDAAPVNGARVYLDGDDVGTTSSGGTLTVGGLNPGPRKVKVEAPLFGAYEDTRELRGETQLETKLAWRPGVVRLSVRDPQGAPVRAMARFHGAAATPPLTVGDDGERLVELSPGRWRLVVSSEAYRVHQSDHEVKGAKEPEVVAVTLAPPMPERASLAVRVVDPDGAAVPGASVTIGDRSLPAGEGGAVLAEDLPAEPVRVRVSAPGWKTAELGIVDLVDGSQSLRAELGYVPRPVQVIVKSDRGRPIVAEVRWTGPVTVPAASTDAEGQLSVSLRPGRWQMLVSAPEMGAKKLDLVVRGGEGTENVQVELAEPKVEVTASQVVILQQVQFEFNDDTIRPESAALLDEVAAALLLNPTLRVEIQGHTDNVGSEAYNLDLSERRARAVRNDLQRRGVDGTRLLVKGYGTSVPIAPNTTEKGRTANRRVQFLILP